MEVREVYNHDIELQLQVMRRPVFDDAISVDEHIASAAVQSLRLSPIDARTSRENLESHIRAMQVCDIGSCESWTALAASLLLLLEADGPTSALRITQLRDQASEHLRTVLGLLNPTQLVATSRFGWERIPAFERFASVVGQMADIAGVTYDDMVVAPDGIVPVTLCALAFSAASVARNDGKDTATVERFLAAAIRHMPEEPVPYYFRALWAYQRCYSQKPSPLRNRGSRMPMTRRWIDDLETACRLSPDWGEPRHFLESIHPNPT
jgi:hypothetical protein